MKPLRVFLLAAAATVAYFPVSAGAFGFGASQHEYPPGPWAYGPYGPSPYGPPPNARNMRGMWGSGPGMSWGPRDPEADRIEREKRLEHYRNPWKWTKDWHYVSPYKDAPPWKSPFDTPPGR